MEATDTVESLVHPSDMLKEPLLPVTEKLNQSYVSSSDDDSSSPGPEFPSSLSSSLEKPLHSQHAIIHQLDNREPIADISNSRDEDRENKPSINSNKRPKQNEKKEETDGNDARNTENDSDDLREKIKVLEEKLEQLRILTTNIQNFQIEQDSSRSITDETVVVAADTDTDTKSIFDSPIMQRDILAVHSMLELESPPPAVRQAAEIDEAQLAPTPDLEYRSYTPNYEEELRNIRKTSRGMSMDSNSTHVNIIPSDPNSNVVGSGNKVANDKIDNSKDCKEEEKKKDVIHPSTKIHTNQSQTNGVKKEVISMTKVVDGLRNEKDVSNLNSIQRDILAEAKNSDVSTSTSAQSKTSSQGLPPKSPEKSSRSNLSVAVASSKGDTATIVKQAEEIKNTNPVADFIRGLNIDSRQPDGSASEDVDANMEEFLTVPFRIENLMFFGIAICVDSFLSVLTVTPLKFVWSCLCLICTIARPGKGVGLCRFHRRHLYQLLRVLVIFLTYKYALCPISLGRLYHWIRGQAMLKLYVLLAMVEVFDRLMCSFGQDALDSLYWNTTRRPYSPRMIASTVVVLVYAIIHSLILFVHAATLNVAMNSADSALISLLIGGNFAEIKSTVFKKYNKQSLFKITTSDICERFKLMLFLGLVLLLNCSQGGVNQEMVNDYIYMSFVILGAEMGCDWIKHSFMTKFNYIKSAVYLDYSLVLAGDISHDNTHIDHTHAVVKRLGFAQIPLVCVMFRYLREAARYAETLTHDGDSNHVLYEFAVVLTRGSWAELSGYMLSFFLCLLGLKFLLGYAITYKARSILYGPKEGHVESDPAPKRRQAV